MKSMTAFASAIKELSGLTIRVNIASYNSKFIDINLTLPEFLLPYQVNIYDKIKDKIARGRIEMQVYLEDGNFVDSPIYQKNIEKDVERLRKLKKKFGLKGDIDVSILMNFTNLGGYLSNFDLEWKEIDSFLDELLLELNEVKQREGNFIKKDLENKIKNFEEILDFILSKIDTDSEEKKEKIMKEIKRLNELEIQISREDINLFAFKGDINEELVRLNSHIDYFRNLIKEDGPIGKRLKFLLQEMAREANTIGSKAYTADVVHKVIDLKELIDELREQVENIE
ncbi:YicC family protein [candidate division WOR-3 bacterium]|nr:YicC family protein [candidate division WOR-3 bacterium]